MYMIITPLFQTSEDINFEDFSLDEVHPKASVMHLLEDHNYAEMAQKPLLGGRTYGRTGRWPKVYTPISYLTGWRDSNIIV
jgi:hypothetical protein